MCLGLCRRRDDDVDEATELDHANAARRMEAGRQIDQFIDQSTDPQRHPQHQPRYA